MGTSVPVQRRASQADKPIHTSNPAKAHARVWRDGVGVLGGGMGWIGVALWPSARALQGQARMFAQRVKVNFGEALLRQAHVIGRGAQIRQ